MNQCVVCERIITGTGWLCLDCKETWGVVGVDFAAWPAWIKALKYEEKNRRERREDDLLDQCESLDELDDLGIDYVARAIEPRASDEKE